MLRSFDPVALGTFEKHKLASSPATVDRRKEPIVPERRAPKIYGSSGTILKITNVVKLTLGSLIPHRE
jgi:hypothetical protein